MGHVGDFNGMFQNSIDDYEGERRQREFPRAFHAAGFSSIGEGGQRASALVDCSDYALCCGWVLLADVLKYAGKVFGSSRRPANLHLGAKHLLDSTTHLFVGQEFAAIELVQAFSYLFPEPHVMVNIVFEELLDVFLGAAVVLFRGAVNSRLEFRS
jgi:hypothetical protein